MSTVSRTSTEGEKRGAGERAGNRTPNLVVKSHLLCQLSYAPGGNLECRGKRGKSPPGFLKPEHGRAQSQKTIIALRLVGIAEPATTRSFDHESIAGLECDRTLWREIFWTCAGAHDAVAAAGAG